MRKKQLEKKRGSRPANALGLGFVSGATGSVFVSTGNNTFTGNTFTMPNPNYHIQTHPVNVQPIGSYGSPPWTFAPVVARVCERCGTAAGHKTDPNEPPFVCGICKQGDRWDQRFKGMEAILERLVAAIERLDWRV